MKKRIEFLAILVNFLCDLIRRRPDLAIFVPRVLSNPIFDYTQGNEYSIGNLYHKDGNALKKRNIEFEIAEIRREISVIKEKIESHREALKDLMKLRPKKQYFYNIQNLRDQVRNMNSSIRKLEVEMRVLRKKKSGLTSKWLVEHVLGRDYSSKEIISIQDRRIQPITPEETESLLKKLAFTIRIENYTDSNGIQWHTKLNKALEKIQKGNTTWGNYKSIVESLGYLGFDEISKDHFILGDK